MKLKAELGSCMVSFLLVDAKNFDVREKLNELTNTKNKVDKLKALKQHDKLVEILVKEGANVEILPSKEGLDDMVFAANAGLLYKGVFVPSNFQPLSRRKEASYFVDWAMKKGHLIKYICNEICFEGLADAHITENKIILGYGIERTVFKSKFFLENFFNKEVVAIERVPPFFHLDTCFKILNNHSLIYYPEAFTDESQKIIKTLREITIEATHDEAINFVCNSITFDDKLVLYKCSRRLEKIFNNEGYEVIRTNMSEFLKSGGSARCLVLECID